MAYGAHGLVRLDKLAPVADRLTVPGCYSRSLFHRTTTRMNLPLLAARIAAGFPSPADDYIECTLDLNTFLIAKPSATFHARVSGDSMVEDGILDGDYLIVDRSISAYHNATVVAVVNGEMTVKKYLVHNGMVSLEPRNPNYSPIVIDADMDFEIWGVVRGVYRKIL